jgi:hypothetical protein
VSSLLLLLSLRERAPESATRRRTIGARLRQHETSEMPQGSIVGER